MDCPDTEPLNYQYQDNMMNSITFSEKRKIRKELRNITSHEALREFEHKWFSPKTWQPQDPQLLEEDLSRPEIEVENCTWEPLTDPYSISKNLRDYFEFVRFEALKRIENASTDAELVAKIVFTRKVCWYCRIHTKDLSKNLCPLCDSKLRYLS